MVTKGGIGNRVVWGAPLPTPPLREGREGEGILEREREGGGNEVRWGVD